MNEEEIKLKPISELITDLDGLIARINEGCRTTVNFRNVIDKKEMNILSQVYKRLKTKDGIERENIELSSAVMVLNKQLKEAFEYIDLLKKQIKFLESRVKGGLICEYWNNDKCTNWGEWLLITTFLEHEPEQRNAICEECKKVVEDKIRRENKTNTRFEKLKEKELINNNSTEKKV